MTVRVETGPGPGAKMHKRSGPSPQPAWNLRVAALEYASAVEVSAPDLPQTWDRLRKAAERYTHAEKHKGRPRAAAPLRREGGGE